MTVPALIEMFGPERVVEQARKKGCKTCDMRFYVTASLLEASPSGALVRIGYTAVVLDNGAPMFVYIVPPNPRMPSVFALRRGGVGDNVEWGIVMRLGESAPVVADAVSEAVALMLYDVVEYKLRTGYVELSGTPDDGRLAVTSWHPMAPPRKGSMIAVVADEESLVDMVVEGLVEVRLPLYIAMFDNGEPFIEMLVGYDAMLAAVREEELMRSMVFVFGGGKVVGLHGASDRPLWRDGRLAVGNKYYYPIYVSTSTLIEGEENIRRVLRELVSFKPQPEGHGGQPSYIR